MTVRTTTAADAVTRPSLNTVAELFLAGSSRTEVAGSIAATAGAGQPSVSRAAAPTPKLPAGGRMGVLRPRWEPPGVNPLRLPGRGAGGGGAPVVQGGGVA